MGEQAVPNQALQGTRQEVALTYNYPIHTDAIKRVAGLLERVIATR